MKTVNQIKAKASYVSPSYKAVELSPRAHFLQTSQGEEDTSFGTVGAAGAKGSYIDKYRNTDF